MIKIFILLVFMVLPLAVQAQENALHLTLKTITLLKISTQDRLATAKTPDGSLHLIRVGDELGKGAKVTEITKGKVVVEETTDKGGETVFLILENGVQRIERIRKSSGESKPLTSTGTLSIPVPASPVE